MAQLFEMKRQRRGGYAELLGYFARGHSFGTHLHEQAKNSQTRFLGERGQGFDDVLCFHASIILKIR